MAIEILGVIYVVADSQQVGLWNATWLSIMMKGTVSFKRNVMYWWKDVWMFLTSHKMNHRTKKMIHSILHTHACEYISVCINCISLASQVILKGSKQMAITWPHTANHTCNWLQCYVWEVMDHPPCSPDLAPCHFHLFGPPKQPLAVKWFATDANVKEAVTSWLQTLDTSFFLYWDANLHAMVE